MRTRPTKPVAVASVAVAVATGFVLAGAGAASAHVSIAEGPVEAGAYEILTISVGHGCDGSDTTELAIQIPEGINAVTPTRDSLYAVEKVMEELETPVADSHGNEVTERVAQVVYTANTPLPDGQRDAFELSLQVPEDAAGSTLYFPTVQTCEDGETAWVQIPEDGQDADELESPAPSVEVVAAGSETAAPGAEDAAVTAGSGSTEAADAAGGANDSASAADQRPLVITSLVVGAVGVLLGGLALLRGRKKA